MILLELNACFLEQLSPLRKLLFDFSDPASERATLSVGPPAAKGTTILMGFEGKLSALCADAENTTADNKAPSVSKNVFILALECV